MTPSTLWVPPPVSVHVSVPATLLPEKYGALGSADVNLNLLPEMATTLAIWLA
jgi:hypothetical protein